MNEGCETDPAGVYVVETVPSVPVNAGADAKAAVAPVMALAELNVGIAPADHENESVSVVVSTLADHDGTVPAVATPERNGLLDSVTVTLGVLTVPEGVNLAEMVDSVPVKEGLETVPFAVVVPDADIVVLSFEVTCPWAS